MIIYKPGVLNAEEKATDVDREYVVYVAVSNENMSPYISRNVNQFAPQAVTDSAEFFEGNMMHGVNGRMYNNLDGFEMVKGENVRWFLYAFGSEVDLHTIHWHGNTLLYHESRTDNTDIFPAMYKTLVMKAENPGTFLLHCHVADHMMAGMIASFQVKENITEPSNEWTTSMAAMQYVPPPPTSTPVLWDVSACCSEANNIFFQIMNTLFGWRAVATVATTVAYFGYWLIVICAYLLRRYLKRRNQGVLADGEGEGSSTTDAETAQVLDEAVASGQLPEEVGTLLDKTAVKAIV
jgi:hypothetical protein